jgi:hypothetical protein
VQTDDQRFYPFGERDTPWDGATFKEMPVRVAGHEREALPPLCTQLIKQTQK